jgi:hypothetical protein
LSLADYSTNPKFDFNVFAGRVQDSEGCDITFSLSSDGLSVNHPSAFKVHDGTNYATLEDGYSNATASYTFYVHASSVAANDDLVSA